MKRKLYWQIKDHEQKNIMLPIGILSFTYTRFKNKEIKETSYLLDKIVEFEIHIRMSDVVKTNFLEEAVQTIYEKTGQIFIVYMFTKLKKGYVHE